MKIYVEANAKEVDHIVIQQIIVDIADQSALIYVLSEDASNAEVLGPKYLALTGADYTGWNDDTPYIKNYVLTALGYTETAAPADGYA